MRRFAITIISLFMIGALTARAEDSIPLSPTLRFTGLPPKRVQSLRATLDQATKLIAAYAPAEDNVLRWRGDRAILQNKYLDLLFTDSRRYELASPLDEALGEASDGSFLVDRRGGGQRLLVVVFVDRLLKNFGQGDELDFARLSMTLAGHLFGPAQNFLHAPDLDRHAMVMGPEIVNEESILFARMKFVIYMMNGPEFQTFATATQDEFIRWAYESKDRCDVALAGRKTLQ